MVIDVGAARPAIEEDKWVQRFTVAQRIQHVLIMITMLVLLLTGIGLLFHESWWAAWLIRLEGGMAARGYIHRTAAVVLMALSVWHACQVIFTRQGHEEFLRLLPTRQDLRDFVHMMRFNAGKADQPPAFGKYGYTEKVQYNGVVVGGLIMIVTGLLLWFENLSMAVLPKWVIDVTFLIHGYDGVLVFIVLFLWHLYNVHLNPRVFPMDKVWLTGKISVRELRERHHLQYQEMTGKGHRAP
ncbi:MAG: formate dehydrogenase subunit gamma [Nitrospinota bacterium]